MHGRIRSFARGLILAWVVSLIGMCLVLAANAVTQSLAPAPLNFQIRKAFQTGALPARSTQERDRGTLIEKDCIILGMALNRDPGLPVRIISPAFMESTNNEEINKDPCAILHDVTVNRNTMLYRGRPYHIYVAAFVPLTAALVIELGVASAKRTLLLLNQSALLVLISAGVFACVMAIRSSAPLPFFKILLPLALLAFSGVEYFGQNLSIGMADLGLYGLIALLFYAQPEQWPRSALAIIAASIGVFMGSFEFFTGQVPVMLALPVALLAMKAEDQQLLRHAMITGLLFVAFALAGTSFVFLQKLILVLLVDGSGALAGVFNAWMMQFGDASFGMTAMLVYMAERADRIGQGYLTLGLAYALVSTLFGVVALLWLAWRGGFPFRRAAAIAASMMVIVLWHVIFHNHASAHSEFMVRSMSFVFAADWTIAGFAVSAWFAERAAPSAFVDSAPMGGPSSPS